VSSTPEDLARSGLYAVLVKERLSISQAKQMPPYMICTEQTLLQMAQTRPTTKVNLAKVVGFNTAKISNYGDKFMAAIIKYCVEEGLGTDKFLTEVEENDKLSELGLSMTVMNSYRMHKEGRTVEEVAQERGIAATTIMGHLGTCLEAGADVDLVKLGVTQEIVGAVASCLWEPPISSDVSRLGPVKEELVLRDREDIDWGKLKLALSRIKMEHGLTEEGTLKWDKKDYLAYVGKEDKPEMARYIPTKFTGDKFQPSQLLSYQSKTWQVEDKGKSSQDTAKMNRLAGDKAENNRLARDKAVQDELDEYEALQDELNLESAQKENKMKILPLINQENVPVKNTGDFKSKLAQFRASADASIPSVKQSSSSRAVADVAPAVKRKKELPAWMNSAEGKTEMAKKRMKTNSLFQ